MNPDTIQSLVDLYFFVAVVASICIASSLEKRLRARLPATRPYRWGFYNGCMGVACGPFAVLTALGMAVAGLNGRRETFGLFLALTVWLALFAVSGWFIIQRKRWAWVVGTVVSFNPIVWIINGTYAHNRWGEFGGEAYGSAGTEEKGYELLHDATKLEAGGKAQEALTLYQSIVERYPHTAAGGDAQKSAESLRARLGVESPAPATTSPLQQSAASGAKRRGLRLAVGSAAASAAVLCLVATWAWQHREPMQVAAKNAVPDGVEALKARAEKGDVKAQYNLGLCYYNGESVQQDYADAVKWLRKAADQGEAAAQHFLGQCYYLGRGVPQDYTEAVKWYHKAAEQGNATAQWVLGMCYYNGQGVSQDYTESVKWLRKAADQGEAAAQSVLGHCYYNGQDVQQDYAEAVKWYRKAASQGNDCGQYSLGICYYYGQGVPQDYAEAVKWFQKAVDEDLDLAQRRLGDCYYNGQGVQQDYAEAVKWYRKAAEQGNADAQCNLGWHYYNGQGVQQDYAEAVKWYRKAAEQGDAFAQNILASCYHDGQGVQRDCAEAVKWYRKSADQGDVIGQHNLGVHYANGQGTPRNDIEAYKWYCLAAAQGQEGSAEARDEIAQGMARAEIVEGQRRAAAFVAKKEGNGRRADDISPTPEIAEWKGCAGTGFFVTDDGYFVTCEHVVRGATSFHVRSPSGSLPARLIKKDRTIDVAVLKVDGAFRALPVAAQPRVKLGEAVFTIGFPNPWSRAWNRN
jgi:TPR repeat protein